VQSYCTCITTDTTYDACCRYSRYTAIAMVPKQPGLLQRAIFALATSSEARMKAAVGVGLLLAAGSVLLVRRALQRADR
jgi:hypothetical protein